MNKTQRSPRVIADETKRATENASSPRVTYRNRPRQIVKTAGNPFLHAASRARLLRVTQAIVTIEGKRGETASFLTKREKRERERERGGGRERRVPRNVVHKGVEVDTRACI